MTVHIAKLEGGRVLVDGAEVLGVPACDPEEGWANVWLRDSQGDYVWNGEHSDILMARITGRVEFIPERHDDGGSAGTSPKRQPSEPGSVGGVSPTTARPAP